MQTLIAQYEISTPMFIGGADHSEPPELRPPSIKGALRFWWRALQWGRYLDDCADDNHAALAKLYDEEAILFGAATKEDRYGQGLCLLKLTEVRTQGIENTWPRNNDAGAGFLGYGLDETQSGDPHRAAINKGHFTVSLSLKPHIKDSHIQQLKDALLIWGLLGGLGSRSRRGFGSVAIKQLNGQSYDFKTSAAYFDAIKQLINTLKLTPSMPLYTALSQHLRIATAGHGQDPRLLMNRLGSQYREARKQAGRGLAKLPFGLPLAGNRGQSDENNRRASPLLMHIHSVGSSYVSVVTLLPAEFHPNYPEGKDLAFYRPLQTFMDKMEGIYP